MRISEADLVKTENLNWKARGRRGEHLTIGERVRFRATNQNQLRGYVAADLGRAIEINKKQSYRVQMADGPDGYIFLKFGALNGPKLTRTSRNAFAFAATNLSKGTQLPRDENTTWELDRVRREEANIAVVRLRELTW